MVVRIIPATAILSPGEAHVDRWGITPDSGRVDFVVVSDDGTTFQSVYSRNKKLIRSIQRTGQLEYTITVPENLTVWWHEAKLLKRLDAGVRIPSGRLMEMVRPIPNGDHGWRWHELKILSYKDGLGTVLDDDGNEKPLRFVRGSSPIEQKSFDGSFGKEKKERIEACVASDGRLYAFAVNNVEAYWPQNTLLIDTTSGPVE